MTWREPSQIGVEVFHIATKTRRLKGQLHIFFVPSSLRGKIAAGSYLGMLTLDAGGALAQQEWPAPGRHEEGVAVQPQADALDRGDARGLVVGDRRSGTEIAT